MPKQLEEITATYVRERIRFENATADVIVGEASMQNGDGKPHRIPIKGPVDDDEPAMHQTYRFYGSWSTYRGEPQFHFKTFVRCQPHSRAGIVKYLAQAPNIGQAFARQLWEKFKGNAVKILREQPGVAAASARPLPSKQ